MMTREQALNLARKVIKDVKTHGPHNILLLSMLSILPSVRMMDEGLSEDEIVDVWREAVGEMVNIRRKVKAMPSVN